MYLDFKSQKESWEYVLRLTTNCIWAHGAEAASYSAFREGIPIMGLDTPTADQIYLPQPNINVFKYVDIR